MALELRLGLTLLDFLDKRWTTRVAQSGRSLPGPAASGLQAPDSAQVTIAPAQALSAQPNLLPTQETPAGAAEVGVLLHLGIVEFGAFGGGVVNVGVDE